MKVRTFLAAVALTTTLTACGGSDEGAAPPKASSAPSPTRSTTGTLLDKVPTAPPERPKDVRSEAGALAFGVYANEMVVYALATNDTLSFLNMADRATCWTCKSVVTAINKRRDKVQVGSEPFTVTDGKLVSEKGTLYTVKQSVHYPDGATIFTDTGKVSSKLKHQVRDMTLELEWRKGAWILVDYEVAD